MPESLVWLEGVLSLLWYLFWAFDLRAFLKTELVAPKICLLASAGFLLRFAGEMNKLEILFWLGTFILLAAIYEIFKHLLKGDPVPPQTN